jgi:hypothetical protein
MKNDETRCEACAKSCRTCSISPDNCTSCGINEASLNDLFLLDGKCIETCPYSVPSTSLSQNSEEQGVYLMNLTSHSCVPHPLETAALKERKSSFGEMSESNSAHPIIILLMPSLVAVVAFFGMKMRKEPVELLLGFYGLTEVFVKVFGVLMSTFRERTLHNSGGRPLWRNSSEQKQFSGIIWGYGIYTGQDYGDMTTFVVTLALEYFSIFLTICYL